MSPRERPVPAERLDALLARLRALPRQPVGAHLTEDEFVAFATRELAPAVAERIEAHLASCPSCLVEMGRLCDAAESMRSPESRRRLEDLFDRVRVAWGVAPVSGATVRGTGRPGVLERLREWIVLPLTGIGLAPAVIRVRSGAVRRRPVPVNESGTAADGIFDWNVKAETSGDIVVTLVSPHKAELAGRAVEVNLGAWSARAELAPVAATLVRAEVVLPHTERERLPADAKVSFRVVT